MLFDLPSDQAPALEGHLRQTLDDARFPLAPRLDLNRVTTN
jgi:hypothetical protein